MKQLLLACILLPLISLVAIFLSDGSEKKIATISFWFSHAMGVSIVSLLGIWSLSGFSSFEYQWFTLYEQDGYSFPVLFYLDKVSASYLFCIWSIFAIIVKYCRVYLHREQGYKRFFQTIFAFAFGLNMIVLSGNIEMLFAGWEVVGIASFLLIAFYRHRPQPVRNALRAYTIYRFCDVGLLLAAWMSHLLFHENRNFIDFAGLFANPDVPPAGYLAITFFSWLIILAASGKSAQFPFSFWLPRAMEGPTPSSAIFYGALSIHLGVFLLLRTMPIWSYQFMPRFMIFTIGLLTVFVATLAEKTQSNIKGQVAYASITQVGFMFMELSFGLETIVLLHFMGNAFLRCYQLLVSPSIVAHLLRVEGSTDAEFDIKSVSYMSFMPLSLQKTLPDVIQNTLYVFALQEGNLERLVLRILWIPLKKLGSNINGLDLKLKAGAGLVLLILILLFYDEDGMGNPFLSFLVSIAMIMSALSAFSQKHNPILVWNSVALSSVLAGVAVWLMNSSVWLDIVLFLSGIIPAWLLGLWTLLKMLKHENFAETPFVFRAMAETRPKLSMLLFLSFLGLVGFPITPAFLGEDLLLSHGSDLQTWFALPITITFVLNGIAVARVFLRLCMGRPTEISYIDEHR
ncbi:proton-conducting transporter membrane subunit [Methylomonas sp. AM2-LC]|uniref:proton-conducting transporter transmembrane domain-containing protein n=1 Tax=Methylomonas sp. AM2-LC TaxID=3153301 RepID=UPI003266B31B